MGLLESRMIAGRKIMNDKRIDNYNNDLPKANDIEKLLLRPIMGTIGGLVYGKRMQIAGEAAELDELDELEVLSSISLMGHFGEYIGEHFGKRYLSDEILSELVITCRRKFKADDVIVYVRTTSEEDDDEFEKGIVFTDDKIITWEEGGRELRTIAYTEIQSVEYDDDEVTIETPDEDVIVYLGDDASENNYARSMYTYIMDIVDFFNNGSVAGSEKKECTEIAKYMLGRDISKIGPNCYVMNKVNREYCKKNDVYGTENILNDISAICERAFNKQDVIIYINTSDDEDDYETGIVFNETEIVTWDMTKESIIRIPYEKIESVDFDDKFAYVTLNDNQTVKLYLGKDADEMKYSRYMYNFLMDLMEYNEKVE